MPDEPGKGHLSSAPLSVEDADRLADNFTPFWEVDGEPAPVRTPSTSPATVTVTAPMPAVGASAPKAIGRQTLLGIAPLSSPPAAARVTEAAPVATPPPAPTSAPPLLVTQPMPVVAPALAPVPSVTQPLPAIGSARPPPPPPPEPLPHHPTPVKPSSSPEAAASDQAGPPSGTIKSSPGVPGYAIAYTPKDGPETPAVVIAPEAQSEPEHARPEPESKRSQPRFDPAPEPPRAPAEYKRPAAHTIPSTRTRSPLLEAPAPPRPVLADDLDEYPTGKGKGKLIGALLGGVAALIIGALALHALSGGTAESNTAAPLPPKDVQATAAAAATPTATASAPVESPEAALTEPAPIASAPTPVTPAATTSTRSKSGRPKAEVVASTPTRAAARPVIASESNSAPAKPTQGKGVIVRDAPF